MIKDSHFKKLRIQNVVTETANAKTFVLEPLDDWQPVYNPGQFITLVFFTDYGEKRRSYSISSAPQLGEPLSITVKLVENGEFSRLLLNKMKAGDILYSTGISGFFQLPAELANLNQCIFLAAGSGITPCFSLIKTLLYYSQKKVVLIYSNRSEEDTIFLNQLKNLEKKFGGRLQIRFLFSNHLNVHQSRLSSWLLQQLLSEYISEPLDKLAFYLCGPFLYMQMAEITLKTYGILQAQIIKENFSNLPRLVIPRPPDVAAHTVLIKINGNEYALLIKYPETILAAAKKRNIPIPYSCEAGRCGSCAGTCTSGKIWMAYNEVLLEDELTKGRVLTCQSYPIEGDAVIEF
ncbi:MAG: iron-sulfur cluster-binding domain-containing protein [Bacteroidetes bacterium]|nr:iron-sulfur cluster-binding domain-containing protein [Bacteroidota bacterium]